MTPRRLLKTYARGARPEQPRTSSTKQSIRSASDGFRSVHDWWCTMDDEKQDNGLVLDYKRIGRNGNVRITARFPDGTTYTDKIDSADADDRAQFIKKLCTDHQGL